MKSIFSLIWLVPFLFSNSGYSQNLDSDLVTSKYHPEFVIEYRSGMNRLRLDMDPDWTTVNRFGREELARLRSEDDHFRNLTDHLSSLVSDSRLIDEISVFKRARDRIESVRYTLVLEKDGVIHFDFGRLNLVLRVNFMLRFVEGAAEPITHRVPHSWFELFARYGAVTQSAFHYKSAVHHPDIDHLTDGAITLWNEHTLIEEDHQRAEEARSEHKREKKEQRLRDLKESPIFELLRKAHPDPRAK